MLRRVTERYCPAGEISKTKTHDSRRVDARLHPVRTGIGGEKLGLRWPSAQMASCVVHWKISSSMPYIAREAKTMTIGGQLFQDGKGNCPPGLVEKID